MVIDRNCICGRRIRKERLVKDLWTCWECAGRWDDCPFCGKPKRKANKRCQECRTAQQRAAEKHCKGCGAKLTKENWPRSVRRKFSYQCRECRNKEAFKWRKPDRELVKRRQRKTDVMAAYGGKCQCCGETELAFLTIDHINNDGHLHRKEVVGAKLYGWLKKRGYPQDNFQCLCMNCNWAKSKWFGGCPHEQKRLRLIA